MQLTVSATVLPPQTNVSSALRRWGVQENLAFLSCTTNAPSWGALLSEGGVTPVVSDGTENPAEELPNVESS